MVNDLRVNSISTWKFVYDTTISEVIPKNFLTHTQSAATSVEKWSACRQQTALERRKMQGTEDRL
jgi:hypothetical protein